MKFHVYAFCWNEEKLLPAFLKHYEQADKIIVYDNNSTDSSCDIIKAAGREVVKFDTGEKFDDKEHERLRNNIWKESKGKADWVIVQDLDEFVHFPKFPNDLKSALNSLKNKRITGAKCIAYTVVLEDDEWKEINYKYPPTIQTKRCQKDDIVWPGGDYDKPLLFDPNKIIESKINTGGHNWQPIGIVNMAKDEDRPYLIHFKHLGKEYEFKRRIACRDRLRHQFHLGMGIHYNVDDETTKNMIEKWHNSPQLVDSFPVFYPDLVKYKPFNECLSMAFCVYNTSDYISEKIRNGSVWEPNISRYIQEKCKQKSTLFFDIGSNLGCHVISAVLGNAKKVHCFEPNPNTFQKLNRMIKANSLTKIVTLNQVGISNIADSFNQSSFIHNEGGSFLHTKNSLQKIEGAFWKVNTIKLDDYKYSLDSIEQIVVKIDVEGHENEALDGMSELLKNKLLTTIIIELNHFCTSKERLFDIIKKITSYGFEKVNLLFLLDEQKETWYGKSSDKFEDRFISFTELKNLIINDKVVKISFTREV